MTKDLLTRLNSLDLGMRLMVGQQLLLLGLGDSRRPNAISKF